MANIIIAMIVLIGVYNIPESPKFQYANNRFDETRETLKSIAKRNRNETKDEDIDSIVFDLEETVEPIDDTELSDLKEPLD